MHKLRVWCSAVVAAVALALGLPASASAQGFGVYEHSACAMGRAGATVADPCGDGSSMFFNPAGIAVLGGNVASAGLTLIAPNGNFTNQFTGQVDELKDRVFPVPAGYIAIPFKDRFAAGIGVFAPYGLETEWPESASGRFLGYKSRITAIYVQPSAAVKVNDWLSVGAGFDINFVSVELRQHLDLSQQDVPGGGGITFANLGIPNRTDFANAVLEGSTTSVGYNVGILAQPLDWISVGVRFLSRQKATIDGGTLKVSQISTGLTLADQNPLMVPGGTPVDALVAPLFGAGGTLTDQGAATVLRFPEQLVLGASIELSPGLKLLVDYQYTNWRVFETLPINFERLGRVTLQEHFIETHGLRLGGEYAINPETNVRLGFLRHGGAAPAETVTPNLPEGARSEFTVGFGTRLYKSLRFDAAYQYIDQVDRRGRSTDGGLDFPTAGVNDGLYQFDANLFGLTLIYKF